MVNLKRLFSSVSDKEYDKGISAYNNYQYIEAIVHFDKVLDKKGAGSSLNRNLARFYCAQAHRNIGIIRFAAGNYEGSLSEFQSAMNLNKEHVDLFYFMGICHNNLQNFTAAADAFDQLLKIDPGHMPTRLKLAITFHNLGMWQKSVALYQTILKQNPDYADVHYHLGLAFLGEGRPVDAVSAFNAALAINPDYLEANIKCCITLTHLGEFDKALSSLKALNEKYPEYPDLLYYTAIVHAGRNDMARAVYFLKEALKINPNYMDAKIKLTLLYCREGLFSLALEELDSLKLEKFADADLAAAKQVLRSVMAEPTDTISTISGRLAPLMGGDKSIGEIIRGFNKSIDITPNFSEMVSLVEKHTSTGEQAGLWKMLLPLALEHIRQHPDYADLYNTLGALYLKLDQIPDAEQAFARAVAINKNYVRARINLFLTLKNQDKYREALVQGRYLTDDLGIRYPDITTAMGEVYFALGQYATSLGEAEKALGKKKAYAPAQWLLAQSLERLNRAEEALGTYERLMNQASAAFYHPQAKAAVKRIRG